MIQPSVTLFALATLSGWALVVGSAALLRSRGYAVFRGVLLGIHSLVAVALWPYVGALWNGALWPAFVYLHVCAFIHPLMLVRPEMRPVWYRALVSIPEAFFLAGTFMAFPWAIVAAFGVTPVGWWIPYLLAAVGVVQALTARTEVVDIVVGADAGRGDVHRADRHDHRVARPLRIVQITDPHLGPFMSADRLRGICQRALEHDPDLVLLTGDFLTMESQRDPEHLATALRPLAALEGRVFACHGNHDHEAPATVRAALQRNGIQLLVDEASTLETEAGPVQIVGVDFRWRGREEHLKEVCTAHPREPGALRILLLHDPSAFQHVPAGEGDLVLSGHTHGGQVGIVSLGGTWTFLRAIYKIPDHGLWARGTDRLYVHRGTGHYGFPLRIGVPAEESLIRVHPTGTT